MLFMIIEHYRNGDARPVYERFRARGRLAPDGLRYVNSWVTPDLAHCYQVMECEDRALLDQWIAAWDDIVDFEVHPVITSADAAARAMRDPMTVRNPEAAELDRLARVWFDAWRDAHEHLMPEELKRIRTLESFRERLEAALPAVRVVGAPGEPVGFCMLKDDELYQLFVAASARGSGAAAALVADAEARLAAAGVETAWLACAIGNERAARFYEKCGWRRTGTVTNRVDTPAGELLLDVWRYEKDLRRPRDSRG